MTRPNMQGAPRGSPSGEHIHMRFGNKIVISAEGKLGIGAVVLVLVIVLVALGGLYWLLPFKT